MDRETEELKRQLAQDPANERLFKRLLGASRREGPAGTIRLLSEIGLLDIDNELPAIYTFCTNSSWIIKEISEYFEFYYDKPILDYRHTTDVFDIERFLNAEMIGTRPGNYWYEELIKYSNSYLSGFFEKRSKSPNGNERFCLKLYPFSKRKIKDPILIGMLEERARKRRR